MVRPELGCAGRLPAPLQRFPAERWLHPVGFGTLGFALPAGIGAHKQKTVTACVEKAARYYSVLGHSSFAPGNAEGGLTTMESGGAPQSIYDAAMAYQERGTPLVIIAGKEYGSGSSRDWAAKGTMLLGVRAVIAESFERIHRSNLVGIGLLPLQFKPGENAENLGLTGHEVYDVRGIATDLALRQEATIVARKDAGKEIEFQVVVRLDTPVEVEYYKNGGIMQTVLRKLVRPS